MRLPWTASGGQRREWRRRLEQAGGRDRPGAAAWRPSARGLRHECCCRSPWLLGAAQARRPQAWPAARAAACSPAAHPAAAHASTARIAPRCKPAGRITRQRGQASARAPAPLHANPRHSLARCWMVDSGRRAAQKKGVMDSRGWLEGLLEAAAAQSITQPAPRLLGIKCDVHATAATAARLDGPPPPL